MSSLSPWGRPADLVLLFIPLGLRPLRVACQGVDGATTVASTAFLASLAGVRVFVTGGIGGVHRGAETTFDISADLTELARTPVVVVCAGVKSILDVEKTLEVCSRSTSRPRDA